MSEKGMEKCMEKMQIWDSTVGLVILVIFISDSASDVKKTGTGDTNSGGDEGM